MAPPLRLPLAGPEDRGLVGLDDALQAAGVDVMQQSQEAVAPAKGGAAGHLQVLRGLGDAQAVGPCGQSPGKVAHRVSQAINTQRDESPTRTLSLLSLQSSIATEIHVGTLTIRNLEDPLKNRLRMRAAARNRSMEEEARQILRAALQETATPTQDLGRRIRSRFAALGDVRLAIEPREPPDDPPRFDDPPPASRPKTRKPGAGRR
jgi:plasmid stability protein